MDVEAEPYTSLFERLRKDKFSDRQKLAAKVGVAKNTAGKAEDHKKFGDLKLETFAALLNGIGETPESFFGEVFLGEVERERRWLRNRIAKRLASLNEEQLYELSSAIDRWLDIRAGPESTGRPGRAAEEEEAA